MNIKNLVVSALVFFGFAFYYYNPQPEESQLNKDIAHDGYIATFNNSSTPPCLQMYYAIEEHAETYNIPKRYAYGIAFKETRYQGPFHWMYKHSQTSYAGAIGPMQIMPSTGDLMWGEKVNRERLMNDIDFNVETSMKLLRRLYDKYKDWKTVFGCYNTGTPCVNGYAIDVYNYDYQFKVLTCNILDR